jgi:cyclophilin family peptidyl-prolyl cis-trans isomerase
MTAGCNRLLLGLAMGGAIFALAGCGGGQTPHPVSSEPDVPVSIPAPTPAPSKDPVKPPSHILPSGPPLIRDPLHREFAAAIRSADDPPAESNRPPDTTLAGKGVFALYQQVQKEWDGIRFLSPAGKKIAWKATLETEKGVIEIVLFPEQAPNHVRNFLALCRVGYFDGLCFERVHVEEGEGGSKLETVEFGCPEGTGEAGNGSIGYWLKPEFNKLTHEEGTLGALRGNEEDTAACRCYITLSKAPYLDGKYTVFGKVTKGLDVARIIFMQPVVAEDAARPGDRRVAKPVKIVKVSLHQQEE